MASGVKPLATKFEAGKYYRFSLKTYTRAAEPNDLVAREELENKLKYIGSWHTDIDNLCFLVVEATEGANSIILPEEHSSYTLSADWCVEVSAKMAARSKKYVAVSKALGWI